MEKDAHDTSVELTVTFPCPQETLWKFWTEPSLMKKWFGSDPLGTVSSASSDLRVAGRFLVHFRNSDGTEHMCCGEYCEISPPSRLVSTWFWQGRENHVEKVTVVLNKVSSGAEMVFCHQNIDPLTSHNYTLGWTSTFEKLLKAVQEAKNKEAEQ